MPASTASQSVTARALRAGSTSTSRPVSKSKMPVTSSVGWVAVAARNEVSSSPIAAGAPRRAR